eukprot:m.24476 g.24476  ORF g.24476 m.24476 type:complete len:342 (+) comp9112_c0_seq1:213-1238(+)
MENPDNRTGLLLAVISSAFSGASLVIKKKGLIRSRSMGKAASEGGFAYLKDSTWWLGMITLIVGGLTNFAAYAFAPAILVTPLGALGVLISAMLASILLEEHLFLMGKVGSFLSIVGSTVIALNAPEEEQLQSVSDITHKMANNAPFIVFMVAIVSVVLYTIFVIAPKQGKKNMVVYTSICSLVGSIAVIAMKGLSVALKLTFEGNNQLDKGATWIFALVLIPSFFTQMNFLNKALDTFNTALVSPMYYVLFTAATIIASALLFAGWQTQKSDETAVCPGHEMVKLVSSICGFITICVGVYLLHYSRRQEIKHAEREEEDVVQAIADTSGLDHLITSLDEL